MGKTELKIGQRIDVFEIINSPYDHSDNDIPNGTWACEAIGSPSMGSKYGRDIVCESGINKECGKSLHHCIPNNIHKVGTLIIKSIK